MNSNDGIAIAVEALTKSFGEVRAVNGLSFQVREGEIFGLVGPDGAGKTTALRMLAGILAPDAGQITVAGCNVVREADAAKHLLSYMPQRFGLYEDLTVHENICFYADLFGVRKAERIQRADVLLRAAGMSEFRKRLAGKLSGGMKQKLGLVCALIHRPKVILLDEPTTGVDPVSRRDFWAILYELLHEGVTILTTTSYLDEAERCHRVGLMHHGELLFCDSPAVLKAQFRKAVLSVQSHEPRQLRHVLEGTSGISTLVMTGDGIHLVVDSAELRLPMIAGKLREAGVPYEGIQQVPPTIEDLFVDAVSILETHHAQ